MTLGNLRNLTCMPYTISQGDDLICSREPAGRETAISGKMISFKQVFIRVSHVLEPVLGENTHIPTPNLLSKVAI